MATSQRHVSQHAEDVGTRRQRISKACDQCNAARAKCDGNQPCVRCIETQTGETCSYSRPSRRHGRGSKVNNRPIRPNGRPSMGVEQQQASQVRQHDMVGVTRSSPSERNQQPVQPQLMNEVSNLGFPHGTTSFAWLADGVPFGGVYDESNWLNDVWTQQSPAFNINPAPPMQVDSVQTPYPAPRALRLEDTPRSSTSLSETVRYPVLTPLMPYLARILSPALASDLLESYVGYAAEGDFSPTSPLLLAHIFRAESLLSLSKPRKCSLALLASMLLVSANTTEFPFFGANPSARSRLYQQLLQLTVALMDKGHPELRKQRLTLRSQRSGSNAQAPRDLSHSPSVLVWPSKVSPIDDIVTLIHIALVTTTTEAKPPGSHYWRTAIQLAKDFRLNQEFEPQVRSADVASRDGVSQQTPNGSADIENTGEAVENGETSSVASPMSVSDNAIVEHNDSRSMSVASEEREERRRIWWTLYIWDRHLALRYNSPLSIKDAESQDTRLPMDEATWQMSRDYVTSPDVPSLNRPRGPPSTIKGKDMFSMLIPLMCILGQIIDMHHVAYHPRVERGPTNPVAEAYTETIRQQLLELQPSIATLESQELRDHTPHNHRHHQLLGRYATFLFHLFYMLLHCPWDKLAILEQSATLFRQRNLRDISNRCVMAATALRSILVEGPDLGFMSMFFGIFLYHGSTVPWAIVATFKQEADAAMVEACEVYARAFEASNCSYQAEYLRKMRRLILLTLSEIRGTPLSKTDINLQNHILRLYRWTGDGTGLAL